MFKSFGVTDDTNTIIILEDYQFYFMDFERGVCSL